MSKYYFVTVTVEDFRPENVEAIVNAAQFVNWSVAPQQFWGTLDKTFSDGETEAEFEARLTQKIIEANQADCHVAIDLES